MSLDTDVLIIGAGMSGIGLAIQLKKKYPHASYEIYEKANNLSGTWWANTYPGCGCDVPSHLYSFSFALNPEWTRPFALQPEILAYFRSVAQRYGVDRNITYQSTVQEAAFDSKTGTWLVTIFDQKSNSTFQRRAKVLISAVGALSTPKDCEIKGAEKFQGKLFHSAEWDHSFDWAGKDVVVVGIGNLGNGCSATQFVPIMTEGKGKTRKLTQFSRQAHWLIERPNPLYSPFFKWAMRNIPGLMKVLRSVMVLIMDSSFSFFFTETGRKQRAQLTKAIIEYIKKNAPEKYHAALIPNSEIGCKRRVMDTDYLACLHREEMELIATDPIEEITETGVTTKSGKEVKADAIVLATGFKAQQVLYPLVIKGENGTTLNEHWKQASGGTPQAYYGTCLAEFPNLFVMMGPNTATGHMSVIYTTECQINFALRVLRPVMESIYPSTFPSLNPFSRKACDTIVVTKDAERKDNEWVQEHSKKIVWTSGCTSWYLDESGKNTLLYPDYQIKFWLRSIFIPYRSDFAYANSPVHLRGKNHEQHQKANRNSILIATGLIVALAAAYTVGKAYGIDSRDIKDLAAGGRQNIFKYLRSALEQLPFSSR
ncbi:hypothetical protein FQN57_006865 [Myotisia sp. PD_48]|nr:hypothetical protein FQN57_006865 [Myotisia sp. PD_48]